jgi:hypothetical protein
VDVGRWLHGRIAGARSAPVDSAFDERVDIDCIRRELAHALRDCRESRRVRFVDRIRRATQPMELWAMRPEIFLGIAQDLGQVEATRRINALTPLFRGWVPPASAPRMH